MVIFVILIICCVFSLLYLTNFHFKPQFFDLKNKHVLITGGSSGIGLSVAKLCAKYGAHITLFARNRDKLKEAARLIELEVEDEGKCTQVINVQSVDLMSGYDVIQAAVDKAIEACAPVDVLINCAGFCVPGEFENTDPSVFRDTMLVNYLASVNCTLAVVKRMPPTGGRIGFVSSQAGQVGLYGYSSYAPTKFALRAFAECLQLELFSKNIYVTVVFPPDTDTPGFTEEKKITPKPTEAMSESSGLWSPDTVGKKIVSSIQDGDFVCWYGVNGWLLTILSAGFSPVYNPFSAVIQIFLSGIARFVAILYTKRFYQISYQFANRQKLD